MSRLFVRNLTVIDFAYLHGERGLLGESWRVHVELGGALDAQGMVFDFAHVKRGIKQILDQKLDHRLLVPTEYPRLRLRESDAVLSLDFELTSGSRISHRSPSTAVALIAANEISPSTVSQVARELIAPLLPSNVTDLRLELEPEQTSGPYFHYAHGLKHHQGNCQRIAHGHRSRIEIYREGVRDTQLEDTWARRWWDIYIATHADQVSNRQLEGEALLGFRYRSAQGEFELELPARRCYLIEADTTIEHLAQHVADVSAREYPGETIRARICEGIDKGAVGTARFEP